MDKTNPLFERLKEVQNAEGFLDLVDSDFHRCGLIPPPEPFAQAFSHFLMHRTYTPWSKGCPQARLALSQFYQTQGLSLSPENFILTAGTSEAYRLIFDALLSPGDSVLVSRPGYPLFEELLKAKGIGSETYSLSPSLNFAPDPFSLEAASSHVRALILISPHNPTGRVLNSKELIRVGSICQERGWLLICDEVFDLFYWGTSPLPRPAALLPQLPILTLNGISKRFASPDLKLAWLSVSGPENWASESLKKLETLNDLYLSTNSYSSQLLPKLFLELGPFQEQMKNVVQENRELLAHSGLLNHYSTKEPKHPQTDSLWGGIHFLFPLPPSWPLNDEETALQLLQEQKLLMHPGYLYDCPEGYLVGTFLKEPLNFKEGISRLKSTFY